jgi:hypothetical protein
MSANPVLQLLLQHHTGLVSSLEDAQIYIAAVCSEVIPVSEKRIIFSVRPQTHHLLQYCHLIIKKEL